MPFDSSFTMVLKNPEASLFPLPDLVSFTPCLLKLGKRNNVQTPNASSISPKSSLQAIPALYHL
jgi:hypothetical protein